MLNENEQKQASKRSWLKKLGATAFSASVLLSQGTASADPLVRHLLDQAASRVLVARREDQNLPNALVLEPSTDNPLALAGHRSHSSHASHSSHSSHSSHRSGDGGGSYGPPATPPPSAPPRTPSTPKATRKAKPVVEAPVRKTVQLRDGSELVGTVKSTKDSITVESRFGTFDLKTEDVQSVKIGLISSTFAVQDSGESVITLKGGKRYRGNLVETDDSCSIKSGSASFPVVKEDVLTVETIVHPPATWTPPDDQWYWITLRDGSRIRTKVNKDGDDHALAFDYGKITAKTKDILVVRKIPKKKDDSETPLQPKAESPSDDDSK